MRLRFFNLKMDRVRFSEIEKLIFIDNASSDLKLVFEHHLRKLYVSRLLSDKIRVGDKLAMYNVTFGV
jgi:hypothetical protein